MVDAEDESDGEGDEDDERVELDEGVAEMEMECA